MTAQTKKPENCTANVQQQLLDRLLYGRFASGQPLKESLLAREYGVARSVVREVLCQAVGWGIVENIPFRGFAVREFTINEYFDWFKLRLAIEPLAARELAERRPPEVLQRLHDCCELEQHLLELEDNDKFADVNLDFHRTIITRCGITQFAKPAVLACLAVCFNYEFDFRVNLLGSFFFPDAESYSEADQHKMLLRDNGYTLRRNRIILETIESGTPEQAEKYLREYTQGVLNSQRKIFQTAYGEAGSPDMTLSQLIELNRKFFTRSAKKTRTRKRPASSRATSTSAP